MNSSEIYKGNNELTFKDMIKNVRNEHYRQTALCKSLGQFMNTRQWNIRLNQESSTSGSPALSK